MSLIHALTFPKYMSQLNTNHANNPDNSQIDVRPRLSIDSTRKLSSVGRNH